MASISACAVGSWSAKVRLPAVATTRPSRTITQPTGTSPRACARRASSSAMSMKDGILSPRSAPSGSPCVYKGVDARHKAGHEEPMNAENDHKAHRGRKFRGKRLRTSLPKPEAEAPLPAPKEADRIAKVIARAGLTSRREAEAW